MKAGGEALSQRSGDGELCQVRAFPVELLVVFAFA
jgi:hypothetical protein